MGISTEIIRRRYRALDYLVVAQLFLQDNFLLKNDLTSKDIKPRLLGHWGTCHGINVVYSNLKAFFEPESFGGVTSLENVEISGQSKTADSEKTFSFVLGPGHGFPALQANLFLDGELEKVNKNATRNLSGLAYLCRNFSWPGGFPSHASPLTPGVVCEGGELGYALATAYGSALGHPEKTVAVLIGDGEFETATALASMNLVKLFGDPETGKGPNGRVIPILHLNGYKISAPTISARKSPRELAELIRGFGFTPVEINTDDPEVFQQTLFSTFVSEPARSARGENYATAIYDHAFRKTDDKIRNPFIIYRSEKGATGPEFVRSAKVSGNFLAHQIPLKNPRIDAEELKTLDFWLRSYGFNDLFDEKEGFKL